MSEFVPDDVETSSADESAVSISTLEVDSLVSVGSDSIAEENVKGKKCTRNSANWECNRMKQARVEGKKFVSVFLFIIFYRILFFSGSATKTYRTKKKPQQVDVPARQQLKIFECRCKCSEKIFDNEKDESFGQYNAMTKDEQNLFHQNTTRSAGKKRQRKRVLSMGKDRNLVWTFFFKLKRNGVDTEIVVCKKAYLNLLGIKKSRLATKVLVAEPTTHKDRRGKHDNRPNRTPEEEKDNVQTFIRNLPARESHYSRAKQGTRKYLQSDVTVSGLYREFLLKNPECNGVISEKCF